VSTAAQQPFHPIVYVRGFAATQGEIDETVADPYMGFNVGSAKDYEVDGALFLKRHYEGGHIYRELILVEAFHDSSAPGGWRVKYGYQEINPGKPGVEAETRKLKGGDKGVAFEIPIEQKARPGLLGKLRIEARPWS
jgi:hypothetical protein